MICIMAHHANSGPALEAVSAMRPNAGIVLPLFEWNITAGLYLPHEIGMVIYAG
jgi:hypothetical protein